MEFSADVLKLLRKDDKVLRYRDKPAPVFLLAPVSTRSALESLRKIEAVCQGGSSSAHKLSLFSMRPTLQIRKPEVTRGEA